LENDLILLACNRENYDNLHWIAPIEALENAKFFIIELLGQATAVAIMPLCRSSTY
jgi:hypothetical protein